MLAAGSPLRAPRGLMTAEAGLAAYDFHLEVTRLLWGAVAVLALALYLEHALSQLPRILSLQDRNPYAPTYGSFNRLYWLDKTHAFPDAIA